MSTQTGGVTWRMTQHLLYCSQTISVLCSLQYPPPDNILLIWYFLEYFLFVCWRFSTSLLLGNCPTRPLYYHVTTLGKLFTHILCLSPSSIIWYWPKGGDKGRWCSAAGKVTAGLAESNDSLSLGLWQCHLCADMPRDWHQLWSQRSSRLWEYRGWKYPPPQKKKNRKHWLN